MKKNPEGFNLPELMHILVDNLHDRLPQHVLFNFGFPTNKAGAIDQNLIRGVLFGASDESVRCHLLKAIDSEFFGENINARMSVQESRIIF